MFLMDAISDTQSLITVQCRICGFAISFKAETAGVNRWEHGELIQNALPELSNDTRELLISQTCNSCWKRMFPQP